MMKGIDWGKAFYVGVWAYVTGDVISRYGTEMPAYTVDLSNIIWAGIIWGFAMIGAYKL